MPHGGHKLVGGILDGDTTLKLEKPELRVQIDRDRAADLGVDASQVGLDAAWTKVESFTKRPPRQQGQIVTDEGDGGTKLAEFLSAQKFI
jgi:multidrug efflux pump subunit AcrB